jgi:uncharacterized membrane protein
MEYIQTVKSLKLLSVRFNLLFAGFTAGLVASVLPDWLSLPTRILCIWDTSMVCFLASTWTLMLRATTEKMRLNARQDVSRLVILSLITTAACTSLLAIAFMLKSTKGVSTSIVVLHLVLSGVTILGSWMLVHTIFALHYAHGYYKQQGRAFANQSAGGLDFPNDTEPDYWDFLYFSFVIGMTSQVSDVQISSSAMRRLALVHGILSFFFNTAILAMSINIIAGAI